MDTDSWYAIYNSSHDVGYDANRNASYDADASREDSCESVMITLSYIQKINKSDCYVLIVLKCGIH